MPESLDSIAMRIQELDARIADLRTELREARETREALVDTISGIAGMSSETTVSTQLGVLIATPKSRVAFPTRADNPAGQNTLIDVLKANRLWDRFSVLSYSAFKSAWLKGDKTLQPCRSVLQSLAIESTTLNVRCRKHDTSHPPAGRDTSANSAIETRYSQSAPVPDAPNPF